MEGITDWLIRKGEKPETITNEIPRELLNKPPITQSGLFSTQPTHLPQLEPSKEVLAAQEAPI